MVLIFMHEVFALQQGGIPAEDVSYLLFGWILRSPLFHNIRGFGDALGLQSRNTSFPSVAITQTGLSTKTGAEAKKRHKVNLLKYSSKYIWSRPVDNIATAYLNLLSKQDTTVRNQLQTTDTCNNIVSKHSALAHFKV